MQKHEYYEKTWDWIVESVSDKNLRQNYFKEIYPEETITLKPPKGLDPPKWNHLCKFPHSFVANIPNGRVWNMFGTVIAPNNKLLWDVCDLYPPKPSDSPELSHIYATQTQPPVSFQSGTFATVATNGFNNYFHWFFDILPRFHLLKESGFNIDKYVTNVLTYPFHWESLDILGIPRDKILQIDNASHLQAERLIVPSIPARSGYPKWVVQFLRQTFLKHKSNYKFDGMERIYISREDAPVRKVLNEEKVMEILERYGFKKVLLTEYSLTEKINLFSSAKFIVSNMSAGLSNLPFCNPGTKVIEFFSKTAFDGYWRICNFTDLDYYFFLCPEGTPSAPYPHWEDIYVDLNKLIETLELSGIC